MGMALYQQVEDKIINLHGSKVLLDSDVAELYSVSTKQINQAVGRNQDKFPDGYIIDLSKNEKDELVTNCDRFDALKHSTALPKAFTEKALYMLATILKSPKATETTLAIIETFSKVREIGRTTKGLVVLTEGSEKQKKLLHRTSELISELIQPDEIVHSESEACMELNLAIVKFKYTSKKKGNNAILNFKLEKPIYYPSLRTQ